ncbi:LOW QUALITY PROTEIN: piRNA biogenesis protein EXD1 [Podargus strigoides]
MSVSRERIGAFLGSTVKITLKRGVFRGVLQHVNPDRSLCLQTGRGPLAPQRVCTSAVEKNKQADSGPADCGTQSSPGNSLKSQLGASSSLKYSLSGNKEEKNVKYTVVDCSQQKFGPAVLHLNQQSVVSVAGEGLNLCRHGKVSWLEIATESRVFLFDIFLLGPRAFKNGLQMVLEDKNILKVMHDCCWISDCLFQQYGVLVFNVFDTQVVPFKYSGWEQNFQQEKLQPCSGCSLGEGLSLLECDSFLRPCPASLLKALALKAMCLLLLHSSLMDNLMSDLAAVVLDYLHAYQTGSEDHLESVKAICMELPKDQLADIQKLLREKAIKDYGMNEDGLLIRPAMELERNDPQKDRNHRDEGDHSPTSKAVSQMTSFYSQDVLSQQKLEKENQVVNLWKTLKPTSGWLYESNF